MSRSFTIGQDYRFQIDHDGWVRMAPLPDGRVPVIGAASDLTEDLANLDQWDDVDEATGGNSAISDGAGLYHTAGFDDGLIEGQVADVLWAFGERPADQGRLLEVGCGPGFLLSALQAALPGWTVTGVDPSPTSCAQATARGLDVRPGTLDDAALSGKYDAVVVMGNFQLHYDPAATLRTLADVTNPGAVIFLDSKNPRSSVRLLSRLALAVPVVRDSRFVQSAAGHAFHGMRHGIPRKRLAALLAETGWEVTAVRTMPPRLLRFRNRVGFAGGAKGLAWKALDLWDQAAGERAWIQVAAVRA